ncbi:MAG: hypothetical protein C0478_14830 [Planctomyces sp.]|nr:hypothetical protein [Planctomyces sp.]
MAKAYVPGLTISRATTWKAKRLLPIPGEVLVSVGQQVTAQTPVARAQLPGEPYPVNIARQLQVSPGDVLKYATRQVGDRVFEDEELAWTGGLFGWMPRSASSPCGGIIESISRITGQALIRGNPQVIEVLAYLSGVVTEVVPQEGVVIASRAAVVQGIFGIGPEAYGDVVIVAQRPDELLTEAALKPGHAGKIVVGGGRMTQGAVRVAAEIGIAALVSGGIDDSDLRNILGYDLGVAITGTEKIGTTLVITEGFGDIPMAGRTFELLKANAGHFASCNGATQIRAGVMRPEVVIPFADQSAASGGEETGRGQEPVFLTDGAPVRIIRDPLFGVLGKVSSLPHEPMLLASGAKARVLIVELADGKRVTVPRANVELLET